MRRLQTLCAFLGVFLLSGCGGSLGSGTTVVKANAIARFVTASPNAPKMDVFLNGGLQASDMAYEDFATFATSQAGRYRAEFRPSAGGADLIDVNIDLANNKSVTVFAAGSFATLHPVVLNDSQTEPAVGKASIRVINLAPSLQKIDLYLNPIAAPITDGPADAPNIGFQGILDYQTRAAGTYHIVAATPGTKTVLFESGPVTFSSKTVRTFCIMDAQGGGTPRNALILFDVN